VAVAAFVLRFDMHERWLPVVGYEGQYEVSDHGCIRSVDRTVTQLDRWGNQTTRRLKGRVLKPGRTQKVNGSPGYLFVKMPGNTTLLVHRAVLEAFRGLCPARMRDGCHKDDDPTNNYLDNLTWDTRPGNQVMAVENRRNHNANKTRCKNGHAFTPANTIVRRSRNGRLGRDCRTCQVDRMQRYRAKKARTLTSLVR
jgi:hypothetical protein